MCYLLFLTDKVSVQQISKYRDTTRRQILQNEKNIAEYNYHSYYDIILVFFLFYNNVYAIDIQQCTCWFIGVWHTAHAGGQ